MPADIIFGHNIIRKQDGNSTRRDKEKGTEFAIYLSKIIKLNLTKIIIEKENKLFLAITIAILNTCTKSFTIKEVRAVIKNLNLKKNYDLIVNRT